MEDGRGIRNKPTPESASPTDRGRNLSGAEAPGPIGPRAPTNAYWDIRQLASYLNIKPSTLYAWAGQGKIPCLKLHGLVRFERKAIEHWVVSFRVDPTPRTTPSAPSRGPSSELDALIARAKGQAYTPAPRGNQTEIKPHRKGGA